MSFKDYPDWAIKLVGTSVLFILSMSFGVAPIKLASGSQALSANRKLLFSLANCFAGGVFFSTVILDLFPMVKVKMHHALLYVNIQTEFPMGDFLVGVGFLFMLVLEQVIHSCCLKNNKNPVIHGHGHGTHEHKVEHKDHHLNSDSDEDDHYEENEKLLNGWQKKDDGDDENDLTKSATYSTRSMYSEGGTRIVRRFRRRSLASVETIMQSNFRSYVLVFAISLHSIFEGLATGLIVKPEELLQIYIALLIHKSIIAFSIGVQLVEAELPRKTILICILIFASMTPLGVGLGVGVINSFDTGLKLFFSGVLQAIATGTFLYVTFFEVLPHELNIEDDKKMLKIVFVILGYAMVTGICTYENQFHKFKKIKPDNSTFLVGLDI